MGMRPMETKAALNHVAHDGCRTAVALAVAWRHSKRPFSLAAAIKFLVLICAHGRVLQSKTMISCIQLAILISLLQGRACGAGLYEPDKEKRIQCGCEENPQEKNL